MGAGGNISAFKLTSGNTALFLYIAIGVLVLALTIVIIRLLLKNYRQYKARKEEEERFLRICRKRKLTSQEQEFLESVAQQYQIKRPLALVRSLRIFDKYMALEVTKYREEDTKKRERFKTFVFQIRKKLGFANFDHLEELVSSRGIKKGTRANVTITIANMEKNFEGKVTENDEEGLLVSVPDHFIREEPIRANQAVVLNVTHSDDAVYDFNTIVYKIILGPPGFIGLEHSRTFSRSQRRRFPRIACTIPFRYFPLNHFQVKEFHERRTVTVDKDQHLMEGELLNISGGGAFFHSPVDYEPGTLMWMAFSLGEADEELRDIVGHVERIIDMEKQDAFRIILHFTKIKDNQRDKIVRHVFAKQNELKEARSRASKQASAKKVKADTA